MKKIIITALILAASITAHAQQRIDTSKKVKITQQEIWNIHENVLKAVKHVHTKWHVDGMSRDTLDSYLGYIVQIIEDKYRTAKVDTVKGGKK